MNERNRHDPQRRLPPPVLRRQKKQPAKAKRRPWYRHAAWIIPLGACAAFAVLIAGGLAVRQVMIVVRGGNTPADADPGVSDAHDESGDTETAAPAVIGAVAIDGGEPLLSLESSEPGYEVLPPKAAQEPGRKLRKMLLVGRHPKMFPTLEAALAVSVPGDIIELRTNGPLLVLGSQRALDERAANRPLTIRAGRNFRPVLRRGDAPIIDVKNLDVHLAGLHFVGQNNSILETHNCNARVEGCSFTRSIALAGSNDAAAGQLVHIQFDRCLFRTSDAVRWTGPDADVQLSNSAVVLGRYTSLQVFQGFGRIDRQSLRIENCTIIHTSIVGVRIDHDWPAIPLALQVRRSVYAKLASGPHLVGLKVSGQDVHANPTVQRTAWEKSFREFEVADNLMASNAWIGDGRRGWAVEPSPTHPSRWVSRDGFPVTLPFNQNVQFGERIAAVRELWFRKGNAPGAFQLADGTLPGDLQPLPAGLWAEFLQRGIRYGCDPALLPVPPPATLEEYEVPADPDKKGK